MKHQTNQTLAYVATLIVFAIVGIGIGFETHRNSYLQATFATISILYIGYHLLSFPTQQIKGQAPQPIIDHCESEIPDEDDYSEDEPLHCTPRVCSLVTTEHLPSYDGAISSKFVGNHIASVPPEKDSDTSSTGVNFLSSRECVEVSGYQLNGPIFVGKSSSVNPYLAEPSIIDLSLPAVPEPNTPGFGNDPHYQKLSAGQRAAYLSWLANGRGISEDIGYPFLYLFGFERYVLRTASSESLLTREQKLREIVNELQRLKIVFSNSKSFFNYTQQLLDVIYLLYWPKRLSERKEEFPSRNSIAARFAIAKHVNTSQTFVLDGDWALHWYLSTVDNEIAGTIRNHYSLLRTLFHQIYAQLPDGGIRVPPSKTPFRLSLKLASTGLDDKTQLPVPENWCDPTALKRPLRALEKIANSITPLLCTVSEAFTRGDHSYLLAIIPKGISLCEYREAERIANAIDSLCALNPTVELTTLVKTATIRLDETTKATAFKQLARIMERCGWVLVPDPVLSCEPKSVDQTINVYRGVRPEQLSTYAKVVERYLQLNDLIAMTGISIHERYKRRIVGIVEAIQDNVERFYLLSLIDWYCGRQVIESEWHERIGAMTSIEKSRMSKQIVVLASDAGEISLCEQTSLTELFSQFGLEGEVLSQYGSRNRSISSPAEQRFDGSHRGENAASTKSFSGFELDTAALRAYAHDTNDIQNLLAEIFDDSQPEAGTLTADQSVENHEVGEWYHELLDADHIELLSWLITNDSLPFKDLVDQCNLLNILPEGAIDTINVAAFTALGESLIEPGDPIYVYRDVLPSKSLEL